MYWFVGSYANFGSGLISTKICLGFTENQKNNAITTSNKVEILIFDLKEKYPRFGAKKIEVLLLNHCSEQEIPSVDSKMKVSRVTNNGELRWKTKYWVFNTTTLQGKYVGLTHMGSSIWRVNHRSVFLGFFGELIRKNNETTITDYSNTIELNI